MEPKTERCICGMVVAANLPCPYCDRSTVGASARLRGLLLECLVKFDGYSDDGFTSPPQNLINRIKAELEIE